MSYETIRKTDGEVSAAGFGFLWLLNPFWGSTSVWEMRATSQSGTDLCWYGGWPGKEVFEQGMTGKGQSYQQCLRVAGCWAPGSLYWTLLSGVWMRKVGKCCLFQASQSWFGMSGQRSWTNPTNGYCSAWLLHGSFSGEERLCVLIIWSSYCNFNISPSLTDVPSPSFTQVCFSLHRGPYTFSLLWERNGRISNYLHCRWHKISSDNSIWR